MGTDSDDRTIPLMNMIDNQQTSKLVENKKEEHAPPSSSTEDKNVEITENTKGSCMSCLQFSGEGRARAYAFLGMARGSLVMSNIFLSSAFIRLANEEAGCISEDNDEVEEDCDAKVYGQKPSSLIANIAVISGLLSAFFMPLAGALIDYTAHRRVIGILSALLMMLIQGVQIGTFQSTWFPMAILQTIAGFLYQIQVLATYAYLPEMCRSVGQALMTKFTSTFTMLQFSAQLIFLILVVVIGNALDLDSPSLARVSQAMNVVWILIFFYLGWSLLPRVPARNVLLPGKSLLTEGFVQVWKTTIGINRNFKKGLRWYLLATVFAEAGANSFTVISVSYLDEQLGMSGSEVGIIFIISLLFSLPGTVIARVVCLKTNPNTSWKLSMVMFSVVTIVASWVLQGEDQKHLAYLFAGLWGVCLGFFYPSENLFFSLCLPEGQEAELTGFFIYCTQILVWLPPLVFSSMNESGIELSWALMSLVLFFFVAIFLLSCVAKWEEVLEETARNGKKTEEASEKIKDTDRNETP